MEKTLMFEKNGCKVFEEECPVVLEALAEKAIKFSNVGLVGYSVIEAPATVYYQLVLPNSCPALSDKGKTVVTEPSFVSGLVVRGWGIEIVQPEQQTVIGFAVWNDKRDNYLEVFPS